MVKNDLEIILLGGLFSPEIVFSEKKKESTATQEEQGSKQEEAGSKKGPKI